MAMRKRSGSGSKRQSKDKIVQIYESFFRGEDLPIDTQNFWDEFFLLKPQEPQLRAEIQKLSSEQIVNIKENLNLLFSQSTDMLAQEHQIRIVYSVKTLSSVISALMERLANESQLDVINLLVGKEEADDRMKKLLSNCDTLLCGDYTESLKSMVLKLLLVMVTCKENINENPLMDYIMATSFMEGLVNLLCTSTERTQHGYEVVVLLTLLVNYAKDESDNPYLTKLSLLDDELALNGYSQVITAWMSRFSWSILSGLSGSNPNGGGGWLSSLTSLVGSVFLSDDTPTANNINVEGAECILLALACGVRANCNLLTAAAAPRTQPPSPPHTLHRQDPPSEATIEDISNEQPTNLFVAFFQYCSIIMADTRSEANALRCRLCFSILLSMTEDSFANSIMHDQNLTFKVRLYRQPMRHRKTVPEESPSQTLVETLLDLIVEFLLCHLLKNFPLSLYTYACGVLERILRYERRCQGGPAPARPRAWPTVPPALLAVLKYVAGHDLKRQNTLPLAEQIVNIFNTLITYGDTFLPTPASYDQLYYEIIRNDDVFDNLYCMALRYTTANGEYKADALRLANSLINIRAIIHHFKPKIDAWLLKQHLSTPTQDQILEVVRANYGSLVLKLCDGSEKYYDPDVEPIIREALTTALLHAKPVL